MQELYPAFDGSQPCRQVDPEIFFPESGVPVSSRLAKELCEACDFTAPCLAYALKVQVSGIWGGTTDGERRRFRKAHGIVALPLVMRGERTTRAGRERTRTIVVRLSRLGTPLASIAVQTGLTERSVQRILADEKGSPAPCAPPGGDHRPAGASEDQEAS